MLRMMTVGVLTLCGVMSPSLGLPDDCPNVMASQVEAEYNYHGKPERCGVGIEILGVGGAIFGDLCYPYQSRVPAHQECMGKKNPGTRCVKDRDLIVRTRECDCAGLVIPWIKIGIPVSCECDDWYDDGTVEDFKTVPCGKE